MNIDSYWFSRKNIFDGKLPLNEFEKVEVCYVVIQCFKRYA